MKRQERAMSPSESDHARSDVCGVTRTWTVGGGWKQWRKNGSGESGPCLDGGHWGK